MKNFLAGLLLGVILLGFGMLVYLRLGLVGVRADAPVPHWVARLLYTGIHGSVRRSVSEARSPGPAGDDTLIAGGKLYLNDCVGCHGEPGKPPSEFGRTFYPPVPQFPHQGTDYSVAEVFWIAKHGIRRTGMAAQSSSYTDPQLWTVATFITRMRNLPPNVVKAIQQNPAN
jgi:mono/diheme cytochrome c family protein